MPETSDPAGRRANGLPSADWGALVDLDPRLSEAMLDRLAQAGVAAYVEPAAAVDTVSRAVTMPTRPLDRLWVDPSRADSARAVVAGEVADLTALLSEDQPGATAHGLVQAVPRSAARRVLAPPALPAPPVPPAPVAPAAVTPAGAPAAPEAGRPVPAQDAPRAGDDLPADLHADLHDELPHDLAATEQPAAPQDGGTAPERPAPGEPAQRSPDEAAGSSAPGNDDPAVPAAPAVSGEPALSDDDVFALLVAEYHRDSAPGAHPWPAAEDLPATGTRRRRDDPPEGPTARGGLRPLRPPQPGGPSAPGQGPATPGPPPAAPGSPAARLPGPGPRPGPPADPGRLPDRPPRTWRDDAGRGSPAPDAARREGPGRHRAGSTPAGPAGGAGPGPAGPGDDASLDDPLDDSHFVPPTPPPAPRIRLRTLAAVVAVLVGLALVFAPEVLRLSGTQEVGVAGLALVAGGFVALVWWVRDRDDDEGPDDGAVV